MARIAGVRYNSGSLIALEKAMRSVGFLLALVAIYVASTVCAAETTQKDIDAMQGSWSITSFVSDGEAVAAETIARWQRLVERDHVTWKQGNDTMVELTIKFDPSAKPMTLDSTIATGEAKGEVLLAIYELDGDELRVCFTGPGKPRPKDFSSNQGAGQILFTAKRVKP
jgi:uncharacterized protein (TIGR03067 family)